MSGISCAETADYERISKNQDNPAFGPENARCKRLKTRDISAPSFFMFFPRKIAAAPGRKNAPESFNLLINKALKKILLIRI
jgi:hypothetical protein